jgi:hypothetical protein
MSAAEALKEQIMKRSVVGMCAAFMVALQIFYGVAVDLAAASASVRPANGLTAQGRLLWNLEGLLRRSFPGVTQVGVTGGPQRGSSFYNFSCPGPCAPNAKYTHYSYVFAKPGGGGFHLSSKKFSGGYFGNYPIQLLVQGRSVACDQNETRFLVAYYNSLPFTLSCAKVSAR